MRSYLKPSKRPLSHTFCLSLSVELPCGHLLSLSMSLGSFAGKRNTRTVRGATASNDGHHECTPLTIFFSLFLPPHATLHRETISQKKFLVLIDRRTLQHVDGANLKLSLSTTAPCLSLVSSGVHREGGTLTHEYLS